MSSVDVDAEQVFEACVLEWESRVGLWDQLVGETLATSAAGSIPEDVGLEEALEGWEVEFASVHRRMLLAASVGLFDEVDEASASTESIPASSEDRGVDRVEELGETFVGGLRGDVVDGSGLALGAEWSAAADEVSAAMALTNGLGVWRFVAGVARELSEAKVWSRQLVQWMMRCRLSVALKQWQLMMTGADQVGEAGANGCAGKGEIAVFAEGLGLVFVRSGPQSPEQLCGGGARAAVEGVVQGPAQAIATDRVAKPQQAACGTGFESNSCINSD